MTTFNRFIGSGSTVIIQGNGSGVTAAMARIFDEFFASVTANTSTTINFPVSTTAPNNMVMKISISVITTDGTTGFAASSASIASAHYNGTSVAATWVGPPVISFSPLNAGTTAGLSASWSVSGSNLVLTLHAPTLNDANFVVSTEQFSVY